jgi:hypothetical protein
MRAWFLAVGLIAVSLPAYAIEIDLGATINSPDGSPYQDCDKQSKGTPSVCEKWVDLTLGRLAAAAVDRSEPNLTPQELVQRGLLAIKIRKALNNPMKISGGKINVDGKDLDLIKSQVLKFPTLTPSAVAQVFELTTPEIPEGATVAAPDRPMEPPVPRRKPFPPEPK